MYGRRKRTFRRRFRRGPPLARKRRTWVESLIIDPCERLEIPLCPPDGENCCTTRWNMVVVDNAVLQASFSDRASVRRILGNLQIMFDPDLLTGSPTQDDIYTCLAAAQMSLFCQLLVRPTSAAGQAELPPDIWDASAAVKGYSEAKAKKTWWHHWWPVDGYVQEANEETYDPQTIKAWAPTLQQCIAGVDACLLPEQINNGTGYTWNVNGQHADGFTLGGECLDCYDIQPHALGNAGQVRFPRVWNFQFDIRKKISLREDEMLLLDFQGRSPYNAFFSTLHPQFVVLGGGIKTLLEF